MFASKLLHRKKPPKPNTIAAKWQPEAAHRKTKTKNTQII